MPFCIKCGKRILKKIIPWCDNCRISLWRKGRKIKNNKSKQNMFTNQETETPDSTEPETPEATPEETPAEGEEPKE